MPSKQELLWKSARQDRPRARDLNLPFQGQPGPYNAITDVEGVGVGFTTLIAGEGPLSVGSGPIRTGVTAILPRQKDALAVPVLASYFSFNGAGELTGSHFLDEIGQTAHPIILTNTNSCGCGHEAVLKWATQKFPEVYKDSFGLPIAAETYDGFLNDINGFHVKTSHVIDAIESATFGGPIEEGSVGGGTGMKSFDFKAGSGTASRQVKLSDKDYTIGVFVQSNFGNRHQLTVLGRPIGRNLPEPRMRAFTEDTALGSIIVVVATDAPLLPRQLKRIAKRATIGVARTGGIGENRSGDIFLAFSTANSESLSKTDALIRSVEYLEDTHIDPFFEATAQATEEAILNSLTCNVDMEGRDGNFVPALPQSDLVRLWFDGHAAAGEK